MNQLTKANVFGIGLSRSQKFKGAFMGGLGVGMTLSIPGSLSLAFQAARAGRGGFAPAIVGQGVALVAGAPLAGFASAAVSLIPGIGPITAALIGTILADYGEIVLGSTLSRKIRVLSDTHKSIRHLELGGNYKDTELAQRQRFLAIQDMNSTMIPGRRYLGQEALLMHR